MAKNRASASMGDTITRLPHQLYVLETRGYLIQSRRASVRLKTLLVTEVAVLLFCLPLLLTINEVTATTA